jgi:hypothetical protein
MIKAKVEKKKKSIWHPWYPGKTIQEQVIGRKNGDGILASNRP